MTREQYISDVNLRLSPPLSGRELTWANNAREGGIPAQRFAGWLALTASSPLPLASVAEERSPLPEPKPGGGRIYEER
jgi:hypothetical protein